MVKSKSKAFSLKNQKDKQAKHTENEIKKEMKDEQEKSIEAENMTENMSDQADDIAVEQEQPSATDAKEQTPGADHNREAELESQLKDMQDKYIRLMAEFDNFRKRTLKERMELLKTAGEDILVNILPVLDDFERGLQVMETSSDVASVKQGVGLIYNKFKDFLNQRGVKEIEALQQDFNVDLHEAITKIPAPEESLKGKVVDVVQKGYVLNEKVIRFAKVVIGE